MVSSTLALLTVGAVAAPGAAASSKPLPEQWWFQSWGVDDLLWPLSKGRGVTVAVIDTGVQASLPELAGAVLPGADVETGNGDGRTDNNPQISRPGHGTRMATLIASRGGRTGFLGVAPEAKILPVVAQRAEAQTSAIRWAVDHGASVISMSLGLDGPCPADMQAAIGHAVSKNVVVVASSGNSGDENNESGFPGNCKGVLTVGAADNNGKPWRKTQRQPYVRIAAPGVYVSGVSADGRFNPNYSGTSQAAALTAGMVALARSKFPKMSNRQIVQQFLASAADIGPKGKDGLSGFGFIRPYRVLNGTAPKGTPNPVFAEYDAWARANPQKAPAGGQTEKPSSSASEGPGANMAQVIALSAFGVVALGLLGFLLFTKRRRSPAMVGPYQGQPHPNPHQPPSFGGQHPPQGGPVPPGGQPRPQFHPPSDSWASGPPQGQGPAQPPSGPPQSGPR